MKYTDKQAEHIQYTFRAFCKTVLYREAINAYRDIRRRQKREIFLDDLCGYTPTVTDKYFTEQDTPVSITACGQTFVIEDRQLAMALMNLPEQQREILFLYYFCGYRDREIGTLIGRSRSTANYRRDCALKKLRKEMEALKADE